MTTKRARSDEAKDQRRGVLLSAALDEFYERGFSAAKMDDIARRAGVSKGALYLYYDSKEALFSALVELVALPNLERIEAAMESAPPGLAALRTMTRMAPVLIQHTNLPRLMKVLVSDAFTFPDVVVAYREKVIDRMLALLTRTLDRAMNEGEIVRCDPSLLARLVVAPVVLSGLWQVVFNTVKETDVDLGALFSLHADLLERALKTQGGPT